MQLRTFGGPLLRAFHVHLVSRRPRLPPGTTMADLAEHVALAVRSDLTGPVRLVGVSTGVASLCRPRSTTPMSVDRLVVLSSVADSARRRATPVELARFPR
jgi:hypothetical protein